MIEPAEPFDVQPKLDLLRAFGLLRDPDDPELFDEPLEPMDDMTFGQIRWAILVVHSALRTGRLTLSPSDLADFKRAAARAVEAAGYGPGDPEADFDIDYRDPGPQTDYSRSPVEPPKPPLDIPNPFVTIQVAERSLREVSRLADEQKISRSSGRARRQRKAIGRVSWAWPARWS